MERKTHYFNSLETLRDFIKQHRSAFYFSSMTSTVVPFQNIRSELCSLMSLPKHIEYNFETTLLSVEGGVSWREARDYLREFQRDVMIYPTDEEATVLGGVATSANGERSFAFGSFRDQVDSITILNFEGDFKTLSSCVDLKESKIIELSEDDKILFDEYQKGFSHFKDFKNGPFPRFLKESDLGVGCEGQLGVITSAKLKTIPILFSKHLLLKIKPWTEEGGINFYEKIFLFLKLFKGTENILSVEMADKNSINLLEEFAEKSKSETLLTILEKLQLKKDKGTTGADLIFIECADAFLEEFYNTFTKWSKQYSSLSEIHVIQSDDFSLIRVSIPRAIAEYNLKNNSLKMGTDIEVEPTHFKKLMEIYFEIVQKIEGRIPYTLFGHLGNGHLHLNMMPTSLEPSGVSECQTILTDLYHELREKDLKVSPFAEHGIGLLKQKYIKKFLPGQVLKVYGFLKKQLDPYNQFFPEGVISQMGVLVEKKILATVYRSSQRVFDCKLEENNEIVTATSLGLLLKEGEIVVGDRVRLSLSQKGDEKTKEYTIEERFSRKNEIFRILVREGKKKVTASNCDLVAIIFSLTLPYYKRGLLERYLMRSLQWDVPALIIFNKADEFDLENSLQNEIDLKFELECLDYLNIPYFLVSAKSGEKGDLVFLDKEKSISKFYGKDFTLLKKYLQNKTVLFLGQSGVGKSSLIETLSEHKISLKSNAIGKANKGIHTTTWSELIDLEFFKLIDSPGIRSFSVDDILEKDLIFYFSDLLTLSLKCQFTNCAHTPTSKGCGIFIEENLVAFYDELKDSIKAKVNYLLFKEIIFGRLKTFQSFLEELAHSYQVTKKRKFTNSK